MAVIPKDIPSPIDFDQMEDALSWEATAMQRPFRLEFFQAFADQLLAMERADLQILELGSGPGFLAFHLLNKLPQVNMTLLDFSSAMHQLAAVRLADHLKRVTFVKRNFKQANWIDGLGQFDAVVTLQAVHELRHKRHAATLHKQVQSVLKESAPYLVCDHYVGEDGQKNDQLYMTREEQRQALEDAGFTITEVLVKGGRVLYKAV